VGAAVWSAAGVDEARYVALVAPVNGAPRLHLHQVEVSLPSLLGNYHSSLPLFIADDLTCTDAGKPRSEIGFCRLKVGKHEPQHLLVQCHACPQLVSASALYSKNWGIRVSERVQGPGQSTSCRQRATENR